MSGSPGIENVGTFRIDDDRGDVRVRVDEIVETIVDSEPGGTAIGALEQASKSRILGRVNFLYLASAKTNSVQFCPWLLGYFTCSKSVNRGWIGCATESRYPFAGIPFFY
jgi:hypothetical protein